MYGGSATYQCPTFLVSDCRSFEHSLSTLPGPGALGPNIFFLLLRKEILSHASNFFLSDAFTIRTSSLILNKEGSEHPGLEPGTFHAAVACSPYCDIVA